MPTPVGPRDNDNTRAFLDDPRLDVDIYWLDESFDPAGPLPRRDLLEADYWHGPGWKARIMYGGAIDLGLWNPKRWQRFKHSRLGRRFLCEPCAKRTRLRVGGRRVTVFASRTPRLFIGAVRIRDTVVSVNFPICFSCATGRDPYNSARGMRAIAAGLTLRVPTPY